MAEIFQFPTHDARFEAQIRKGLGEAGGTDTHAIDWITAEFMSRYKMISREVSFDPADPQIREQVEYIQYMDKAYYTELLKLVFELYHEKFKPSFPRPRFKPTLVDFETAKNSTDEPDKPESEI
jgi:hypothetical protein